MSGRRSGRALPVRARALAPAGTLVPALALVAALALGGCLVEPLPDEPVRLSFAVDLPPAGAHAFVAATTQSETGAAACKDQVDNDGDGKIDCQDEDCLPFCAPWDASGYFRLGWPDDSSAPRFPKLVRVAVEVKDLELKSGTWPDAAHGIGAGEGSNGEVGVELQVQAGTNRRLRALGWLVDGQRVLAYEEDGALTVDLVAGKTVAVDLPMVQRQAGAALITVRCQSGNGGPWRPRGVSLADARALVLFPEQPLIAEAATGALQARLDVPVGRYHWVRTVLDNITTNTCTSSTQCASDEMCGVEGHCRKVRYIDMRQQTFVTSTTQMTPVNLALPCEVL